MECFNYHMPVVNLKSGLSHCIEKIRVNTLSFLNTAESLIVNYEKIKVHCSVKSGAKILEIIRDFRSKKFTLLNNLKKNSFYDVVESLPDLKKMVYCFNDLFNGPGGFGDNNESYEVLSLLLKDVQKKSLEDSEGKKYLLDEYDGKTIDGVTISIPKGREFGEWSIDELKIFVDFQNIRLALHRLGDTSIASYTNNAFNIIDSLKTWSDKHRKKGDLKSLCTRIDRLDDKVMEDENDIDEKISERSIKIS